jgi:NAD(P)-dependent dehydrogenase (short-subunit alcohol dehydrogenase family)
VLSSVAGDRGRPRNYTYGAAKGALSLYLQGVRSRLYRSAPGVRVVTIRLGPVDTPMTKDHPKNALFGEPSAIAHEIVRHESRGPLDAYVPGYWRPIMATVRGLPEALFQRFSFLAGR